MDFAVVAGIPIAYDKRLQAHLRKGNKVVRAGWDVRVVRSTDNNKANINMPHLRQVLAGVSGITHVLAFRPRKHQRQIAEEVTPYFRFRWLDGFMLRYAASDPASFVALLSDVLQIEEDWAERLRPRDPRSALVLPKPCFPASKGVDVWELAENALDCKRIDSAVAAIEQFKSAHYTANEGGPRCWVDDRGFVFDHRGPQHGVPPYPRNWKYSFLLPEGFHYDVTDRSGKPFTFTDRSGQAHRRNGGEHVNVDPHGFVRG